MDYLKCKGDDLWLYVYIQPGAKSTAWFGIYGERVKIRLAVPPIDGRANAALCRWLAEELSFSVRDVSVLRGASSRQKVVCFSAAALHFDAICERLRLLLQRCQ